MLHHRRHGIYFLFRSVIIVPVILSTAKKNHPNVQTSWENKNSLVIYCTKKSNDNIGHLKFVKSSVIYKTKPDIQRYDHLFFTLHASIRSCSSSIRALCLLLQSGDIHIMTLKIDHLPSIPVVFAVKTLHGTAMLLNGTAVTSGIMPVVLIWARTLTSTYETAVPVGYVINMDCQTFLVHSLVWSHSDMFSALDQSTPTDNNLVAPTRPRSYAA